MELDAETGQYVRSLGGFCSGNIRKSKEIDLRVLVNVGATLFVSNAKEI